ncbi:MAG: hypothetical protein JWP11_2579 [Frankiales bacterium]|nr:hypothetical protein [Frankiales bacterium]
MASRTDRWPARPALGALLRCAVVVVPLVVAVVAAILLTRLLPAAATWPARVGWWTVVLSGSTLALLLADRTARRTLPLAVLLDLALVFPGRAPSRMRAARTTSLRELEQRLVALRAEGAGGRPIDAAETLVTLVGILGIHDPRTRGHSERVRAFTDLLTQELGLDEDARVRIRWAALVHDIGKLSVPGGVLNGSSDLSEDEWAVIRHHPEEGRRLAAGLIPWLGEWGSAIGQHHERWDGTGYPLGLSGEEIGYGARIVSVADAFDTMTAARSYSRARSAAAARAELTRCAGAQFDPRVVRAFLALSIRRISWVLGPVTWLAQIPLLAAADRAGRAVQVGTAAAAVTGLVVVGALQGPGAGLHRPDAGPIAGDSVSRTLPNGSGTGTVTAGVPAGAGSAAPQALPFVDSASAPQSPRPVRRPSPSPDPSPAPTPPAAAGTVAAPLPASPVAVPAPAPAPAVVVPPAPRTPGKGNKHNRKGRGNGHFGADNAGHSGHGKR